MSQSFRGGNGGSGKGSEPDNSAYEAAPEHPPYLKFAIGLAEIVWGVCSNIVQVTTSTIAVMAMILFSKAPGKGLRRSCWGNCVLPSIQVNSSFRR